MSDFDLILVGSGPAAVATLLAAPAGMRTCVLTGDSARQPLPPQTPVHAKIRAVAYERRERPGIADVVPIAGSPKANFFETATVGGLANYWGQQFVRYTSGDVWPRYIFDSFTSYVEACEQVERIFVLSPDPAPANAPIGAGYVARTPRLLVGTPAQPHSGLLAMRTAFRERLVGRSATAVIDARALSWSVANDCVTVELDTGQRLRGSRLFLAAGVIGTLRLTLASCPQVSAIRFRDHAPKMLYTLGTDAALRQTRADGLAHFNALSIERIEADCSTLFASVYHMGRAELSLLAAAIGLPPLLRGMRAPMAANLIKPIQVWTRNTHSEHRISRHDVQAHTLANDEEGEDRILNEFLDWLRSRRTLFKLTSSQPGGGFHFHAGTVEHSSGKALAINDFLQSSSNGRVLCVDSSALSAIGCRPNALTAMSATWALTKRALCN